MADAAGVGVEVGLLWTVVGLLLELLLEQAAATHIKAKSTKLKTIVFFTSASVTIGSGGTVNAKRWRVLADVYSWTGLNVTVTPVFIFGMG